MFFAILMIALFILFKPDDANAWGPATHIYIGSEVLSNLSLLTPALARLLSAHRGEYLYGCIGADIIFGKKFTPYSSHCHNWKVGMDVLAAARTDQQKAFAYGYLSHLAHDIIAHNYYIPVQLVTSYQTRILRHGYWETRFDIHAGNKVWETLRELAQVDRSGSHDLLEGVLENNLLPFHVNRQIFASWLHLHRVNNWKRMVTLMATRSRWQLRDEDIDEYRRMALDMTIELLTKRDDALCLKGDPTGRRNIAMAKEIRKRLKSLNSGGLIDEHTRREIINIINPRFKVNLYTENRAGDIIKFPL